MLNQQKMSIDKWLRRGSLTGIVEIDWLIADFWIDAMRIVWWRRIVKINIFTEGYRVWGHLPIMNKKTGWCAMKSRMDELDYYQLSTTKNPSQYRRPRKYVKDGLVWIC